MTAAWKAVMEPCLILHSVRHLYLSFCYSPVHVVACLVTLHGAAVTLGSGIACYMVNVLLKPKVPVDHFQVRKHHQRLHKRSWEKCVLCHTAKTGWMSLVLSCCTMPALLR